MGTAAKLVSNGLTRELVDAFQDHLMLFFTGVNRTASGVASSYVYNLDAKEQQLQRMREMVAEGIEILTGSQPIAAFGELLHETWCAKRSLSDEEQDDATVNGPAGEDGEDLEEAGLYPEEEGAGKEKEEEETQSE